MSKRSLSTRRIRLFAALRVGALVLLVLATAVGAGLYIWLLRDLPSAERLSEGFAAPSVRIEDRHGALLYDVLAADGGRHVALPPEAVPPQARWAAVATEDANFYRHPGVDWRGILRALWINLRGREVIAGGSTITQQVARSSLLSAEERVERTLRRKLRESWLAWRITRRYTKEEVLAIYLNQSYFGAQAYGIEAAARTYFDKSAADLTLAQCALLVGLIQSPAAYNPFTDPAAAQARRRVVLGLMAQQGWIDAAERAQAEREPLRYSSTPYPLRAPHFAMLARQWVDAHYTPQQIKEQGGLTVRTTLDWTQQEQMEALVQGQIALLNQPPDGRLSHNARNAALVALDPGTGELLALVGNVDFFDGAASGAINMALAPRQTGSALKPFIYAVGMTAEPPFTPATRFDDVHTAFVTRRGEPYAPVNFGRVEHGPVLLRDALASSLNIPAVQALDRVGLSAAIDLLGALGLKLSDPTAADLALALGGAELSLLDLTAAYAVLANGGARVTPTFVLDVRNARGDVLLQPTPPPPTPVLDPRIAWLLSDILSDDRARELGFGRNSVLNIGRVAAVKTGTTNDFRDNWTVGYTPDLVVGVWVGNADREPMREVTGVSGAGPIWHAAMRTLSAGAPDRQFARPSGLVRVEICLPSGLLPTPACPTRRLEWFLAGTQPTAPDAFYRNVTLDRRTNRLADDATPPEQRIARTALNLPPALQPWARRNGLLLWDDLARDAALTGPPTAVAAGTTAEPLRLIAPDPLTVYRLSPRLPAEHQQVRLAAVAERNVVSLTIWLDDRPLASFTAPPYEVWWPLAPGAHRAWVEGVTADGRLLRSSETSFTVNLEE